MPRPLFGDTKIYAERLEVARRNISKKPNAICDPQFSVDELTGEIWKHHPVLTDYQISNLGRVKGPRRLLKTVPCKLRYYVFVQIRSKIYSVHRLVLETFVGPCPDGHIACHNDGNPANNKLTNLRWDTHQANADDRVAHGNVWPGGRNGSKLSKTQRQKVFRLREQGVTVDVIAKRLGVTPRRIFQILAAGQ